MIMAIPFVGGLALFLLSLVGMSKALGKIIGARTRAALHGASVPAAFASGVGVTALLQSSTLVSVTLVGLVNSGAMGLAPAFAAILGANVGTTVTAQIAGLRPTLLGWVAAGVGLALAGWGWLDIRLPRAAGGPRLEKAEPVCWAAPQPWASRVWFLDWGLWRMHAARRLTPRL